MTEKNVGRKGKDDGNGEKRNESAISKKKKKKPKTFKFTKKLFEGEKNGVRKRIWKYIFGKNILTHSPTFLSDVLVNPIVHIRRKKNLRIHL